MNETQECFDEVKSEIITTLTEHYGSDLIESHLEGIQKDIESIIKQARTQAQVSNYFQKQDIQNSLITKHEQDIDNTKLPREKFFTRVHKLFNFIAIYNTQLPLSSCLDKAISRTVTSLKQGIKQDMPTPKFIECDFSQEMANLHMSLHPPSSHLLDDDISETVLKATHPLSGDLMGYVVVRRDLLIDLAVDPSWEGAGLGKDLLLIAAQYASTCRWENLHALVFVYNEPAIWFLQKFGFKILKKIFPGREYSWHGAYVLQCPCRDLLLLATPEEDNSDQVELTQCPFCDGQFLPTDFDAHYARCCQGNELGYDNDSPITPIIQKGRFLGS